MTEAGPYDRHFYTTVNASGASSASAVLPVALRLLPEIQSAADIGCGTGIWAQKLLDLKISDVLAVDGDYVPKDQLQVAQARFIARDISKQFTIPNRVDLAVCVEVAEHLDPTRAEGFIADLVKIAPAIIFSAAPPGQGGTHHVNEQWPLYWIELFAAHGYRCWDVLRPAVRYDPHVAWIYRQNLMLVLEHDHAGTSGLPPTAELRVPLASDVSFEYVASYILEKQPGLASTLRQLPALFQAAVRNRLPRRR